MTEDSRIKMVLGKEYSGDSGISLFLSLYSLSAVNLRGRLTLLMGIKSLSAAPGASSITSKRNRIFVVEFPLKT